MNGTHQTRAALLLPLALACGGAHASEAALAKLGECMKLNAASAEQATCLAEVERLRQVKPAVAKAAKASAPPPGPAAPGGSAAAKATPPPPPKMQTASAPPEVRQAMNQYDLRLEGMDLETAMMAVQSSRANLLEAQLKDQMESVRKRNEEIGKLNTLVRDLKALRPGGTNPGAWGNLGANQQAGRDMYARLQAAGAEIPSAGPDAVDEPGTGIYDAKQKTYDVWMEALKGRIDSLNSSQQMDMLRLQSLSNKRNEAFELMTNFIRKMSDSRSSVIGNMR